MKSDIFGQLDVVLQDMVPEIGGLLEVLGSRGLLKIYLNMDIRYGPLISWPPTN